MPPFFSIEDDSPARRLLYTVAILFVTIPAVHSLIQLWPLRLFDIRWRFDAANALSLQLMMPFLGLSLMVLLARATENKFVARLVGLISALFVIGLLGSLVLFALDALQLKTIVNSSQERAFEQTSQRIVFSTVIFSVAYSILMVTAFKSTRVVSAAAKKTAKSEPSAGLIVGQ